MQEPQERQVWSLGQEYPRRRKWQPTPVFLPGKSHGQRSLVGYSLWGRKETDTNEWMSLSAPVINYPLPQKNLLQNLLKLGSLQLGLNLPLSSFWCWLTEMYCYVTLIKDINVHVTCTIPQIHISFKCNM